MKKLKKGLSLVLVLVMVFGLATNAFAWDTTYADNDQITYKEAVEAMSGMGIIDGKLDNMFDPAGNYTREEAAKVITYMLLGPETAEVIKPSSTSFSDVDAGRWSAGYISYAAAQDIIVGWDGEFHPEDSLTRAQWLKMLLVALGYDPIEKGLEDNLNWETNALTLAIQIGLIDSKEATATFNRELAIQYAFNALNTPTVNKWGRPGDILGAAIFGLNGTTTSTTDEFGRPYETWDNGETGNDQVVYATNYAEPVLTYSNETVKVADIEKNLKGSITKVVTNGADTWTTANENKPTELGEKSIEVEIYATETKGEYTAIVIELQVMKLEKDDLENKAFADFEEDDVVTYFQGKDGDKNVYSNVTKLEPVEGTITAVATEYIRLDGEQIFKAKHLEDEGLTPSTKVNAYIDSYGNLIYAEVVQPAAPEERQPDGYAQVLDSAAKAGESAKPGDGLFGDGADEEKAAAARAKIIDLTGGKAGDQAKVVDIAVVKNAEDNKWYYANENGTATTTPVVDAENANGLKDTYLYAYYILDDGTYVFTDENLKKKAEVTISAGNAYYGDADAYATKDTVLTVVSVDNMSSPTKIVNVETYTGYTNFPKDAFTAKKALFVVDDKANITNIIAMVVAEKVVVPEESVYAVSQGDEEKIDSENYRYSFNIVETGDTVVFVTNQKLDVTEGKIFTLTFDGEKITKAEAANELKSGKVTRLEETYIVLEGADEGQPFTFEKDYLTYGDYELKVGATVELYGASNDAIDFVYVTKAAE